MSTFLAAAILLVSCNSRPFHIYSDEAYSKNVEQRFEQRKSLAGNRAEALFSVFAEELTETEQEGLKFLNAFMPLSDLADYDGEFFLNQVRWSLAARDTFVWGKTIPEVVFRHFVLPYRVNNENLDTARIVIFNELKGRLRNMNMLDAALEVNHWCHEKVTYRGSDIRTSAPLASMKTAYGRCGEESTFTVTALRAVGIPARQVYTPRWAHSDDNHAWVEFWAEGKWHYMGACEPECVPDLGWFTEPARRSMLIHTKAFGDYLGSERAENRELNYALLNTLGVYAPTKEIHVMATGADGKPAAGAFIEFQLYNYAEYYPISTKKTDKAGYCNFLTGLGDLVIWARSGNAFGFQKISVGSVDTVKITLDQTPYYDRSVSFDMEPPIQREPLAIANDCREENNRLLRMEDSIRGAYENTFPTEQQSAEFAGTLGLEPDRIWLIIQKSRGNYNEIMSFLKTIPAANLPTALDLLEVISDKDLRDTKASILEDHINCSLLEMRYPTSGSVVIPAKAGTASLSRDNFLAFVLNPRIANEMLVAYRGELQESFGSEMIAKMQADPGLIREYILKEIRINDVENYYGTPLTPSGVYNLKVADEHSRKVFAVALLRTCGLPARLKPGTLEPEYLFNGAWTVMEFGEVTKTGGPTATLVLSNDPQNPVVPQYETHYTLGRFADGKYVTQVYGYDNFGDPLKSPLVLDPGFYSLVTGNRQPGGRVLSTITFFEMKVGETRKMMITLRKSNREPEIIASINPIWTVNPLANEQFSWPQLTDGGHMVIAWIEPDKETTKHVFQDLGSLKTEVDKLKCPFVFLIPSDNLPAGFTKDSWKMLPKKSVFGTVSDLSSLNELEKSSGKSLSGQFPIVIMVDSIGRVTYLSSGYKIGIGEELIKLSPTPSR
ncbi:MAG: hypothetical protein A2X22_01410 [Bacteroidetes bacterium GWF2_49_14]|nr:MAG: hypothetical protein A2X22_01410 [Bacteroidetes bacterium GWF2_49_14]